MAAIYHDKAMFAQALEHYQAAQTLIRSLRPLEKD